MWSSALFMWAFCLAFVGQNELTIRGENNETIAKINTLLISLWTELVAISLNQLIYRYEMADDDLKDTTGSRIVMTETKYKFVTAPAWFVM